MDTKLKLVEFFRRTNALSIYRNELCHTQFFSREELENLQLGRLQNLLDHAYRNVPYYQKVFNNLGITPVDIQTTKDLQRLPILTKDIIRNHYQELQAVNQSMLNSRILSSGGSTGEPLRFFIDAMTNGYQWADVYRGQIMAGWNFGDRIGRFWGSSVLSIQKPIQKKIYSWLNDWELFPAFNSNDEQMHYWITQIRKKNIRFLSGYVDTMVDFARFVIANNLQTQMVAVFPTTAPLSLSGRSLLEKAFGCGVFDLYQSADGGLSAVECHEHQGLHVADERCIIEVPKINGDINVPVIVTDLFNYAMPFIRYENGDEITATWELCRCGRESLLIRRVRGKTYHQIILPNGNKVHSEIFSYYLNSFLLVKHFRANQISKEEILLEISLDLMYKSEMQKLIESLAKLPSSLPGFNIRISFVEEIQKRPNQKYELFIPFDTEKK